MIRFLLLTILVLLAARLFWRVMDGVIEAAGGRPRRRSQAREVKLQRDPICGTFVQPDAAVSLADGKTMFYFCSDRCRDEFDSLMKTKRRQA